MTSTQEGNAVLFSSFTTTCDLEIIVTDFTPFITAGFNRVFDTVIGVPEQVQSQLLREFIPIHNHVHRDWMKLFEAKLNPIAWNWPWLEQWHAKCPIPELRPRAFDRDPIEVLIDTILSAAHAEFRYEQGRDELGWVLDIEANEGFDPASAKLAEPFITAVRNGEILLPPFFPGDVSSIRWIAPYRRRQMQREAGGS